MTTHMCSNGHNSTEADFCSVCMEEIKPGLRPAPSPTLKPTSPPAVLTPAANNTTGSLACPLCREPHVDDDGQYCLTCGYDFVSQQSGIPMELQRTPTPPPALAPGAQISQPTPIPVPAVSIADPADATTTGAQLTPKPSVASNAPDVPAAVATSKGWLLYVEINPTMRGTLNEEAPKVPPRTYDLKADSYVLGRVAGDGVDIVVQRDAGISRKQIELVRQPDGSFKVKDLGSANGTKLLCEQSRLEPFAEYPADRSLQVEDVVQIGEWTQITIKQRS